MINTMNRRTGQSSPLRATSTGWARSVAVSALASIALTAMFGAPAGLSSSIGVGAELLAALVVAGSAAALLWTSARPSRGVGVSRLLCSLGLDWSEVGSARCAQSWSSAPERCTSVGAPSSG